MLILAVACALVGARALLVPRMLPEFPAARTRDTAPLSGRRAERSAGTSSSRPASVAPSRTDRQEPDRDAAREGSPQALGGAAVRSASPHRSGPVVALIIDDVGYSRQALKAFLEIDAPLTFSCLPHGGRTAEIARELSRDGRCVMLHLPMEPRERRTDLERDTVKVGMSAGQIATIVTRALAAVPGAQGVNNHMGSRATADRGVVEAVLQVVRDHGLFFVDSVTGPHSKVRNVAQALAVPVAERDVFLDADSPSSADAVARRMEELASVAARKGTAVGIGHVRPATAEGIRKGLAAFEERGVAVVPASDLF